MVILAEASIDVASRLSRGMHVSATQAQARNRIYKVDKKENNSLAQAFNSTIESGTYHAAENTYVDHHGIAVRIGTMSYIPPMFVHDRTDDTVFMFQIDKCVI